MKLITIENTTLTVSPIGLGTVKLGRDQGVKYPQPFTIPDDHKAARLIAVAGDLGINLIDTAPAYGNSEERLGTLLKDQRQQWIICTKVGEEFENEKSSYDFSAEHTKKSILRSLQRLNTDYLDIVLVHSNGNDGEIINRWGTLEALAELKRKGLIRAFGMSTKTVEGGILAARNSDLVMATYNPESTEDEAVLDFCRDNNKAVFIKKAFASGHKLVNESMDDDRIDPVQASMDFVFSHQGTTSVIVGTINTEHLSDNVMAVEKAILRLR